MGKMDTDIPVAPRKKTAHRARSPGGEESRGLKLQVFICLSQKHHLLLGFLLERGMSNFLSST